MQLQRSLHANAFVGCTLWPSEVELRDQRTSTRLRDIACPSLIVDRIGTHRPHTAPLRAMCSPEFDVDGARKPVVLPVRMPNRPLYCGSENLVGIPVIPVSKLHNQMIGVTVAFVVAVAMHKLSSAILSVSRPCHAALWLNSPLTKGNKMKPLLVVVVLACCATVEAQRPDLAACPCGPDWIVGSDRALIPQTWYGADFRPACSRHDACLSGHCQNRKQCDRQFTADLRQACKYSSRPRECKRVTRLMSRAVRSYGGRPLTAYEKNQAIARLRQVNARFGRNPYP